MSDVDKYRKLHGLRPPKERTGFVAPKREPIKWGELAQGSAAGLLGAPVDLVNLLTQIKKPVMGSQWVGDLLGADTSALEFDVGQFIEPGGMAKAGISGLGALGGIIKNKGGNWIDGSIENALRGLKRREMDPLVEPDLIEHINANNASNKWIDTTLNKYVKNRMGTVDDEVRKLADQGITHSQLRPRSYMDAAMDDVRKEAGFPEPLSTTPEGKMWEDNVDTDFDPKRASYYFDFKNNPPSPKFTNARHNEWISKLDPKTPIYNLPSSAANDYGFDHLIDELGNMMDPASGLPMDLRLTPDSLGGLSMEEAIKKVHATNLFRAEKARKKNLRFQQAEGIPVHKEYEDGWRWLEYKKPDELPNGWSESPGPKKVYNDPEGRNVAYTPENDPRRKQLESWLKQEGDTMGHCVGGYCADVERGDTRILSLRDKEGKSVATVELTKRNMAHNQNEASFNDEFHNMFADLEDSYGDVVSKLHDKDPNEFYYKAKELWPEIVSSYPDPDAPIADWTINQVKGPGDKKPAKEAIPFIQDFVRSNAYPITGDLQNTDLVDMGLLTDNYVHGYMDKDEATKAIIDLVNDPDKPFYGMDPQSWLKELAD